MIDDNIQKINVETEVAKLKTRVFKLESRIKYGLGIVTFVDIVISILGWSAWSSMTGKIDELNRSAEKVENRYSELNKQMLVAGQSNVALNTQLSSLSMEIAKKYDELLQRFIELKGLAAKAQMESERAVNNAGLLTDAIKSASISADRAEALALKAQEAAKSTENANQAIQESIRSLDVFLAKNIKSPEAKTFKVSISSTYSQFIISEGEAIAYDRSFGGTSGKAHIVIPPGCIAIINDSGSDNTFYVSNKVKGRAQIEGDGTYRDVRVGEFVFR